MQTKPGHTASSVPRFTLVALCPIPIQTRAGHAVFSVLIGSPRSLCIPTPQPDYSWPRGLLCPHRLAQATPYAHRPTCRPGLATRPPLSPHSPESLSAPTPIQTRAGHAVSSVPIGSPRSLRIPTPHPDYSWPHGLLCPHRLAWVTLYAHRPTCRPSLATRPPLSPDSPWSLSAPSPYRLGLAMQSFLSS